MEPGTIKKANSFTSTFESILRAKQVLESSFEKSHKKIQHLSKALSKEKQQNASLRSQLENLSKYENKVTELQQELIQKNREIKKLSEKIKSRRSSSEESDSNTWKQLYESTKYSKQSTKADYLEISHSIRAFIEKISSSSQLKNFVSARKPLIDEISRLFSTLNFERLLHHICSLSTEIINHYEDSLLSFSTVETEALNTPYQRSKYYE